MSFFNPKTFNLGFLFVKIQPFPIHISVEKKLFYIILKFFCIMKNFPGFPSTTNIINTLLFALTTSATPPPLLPSIIINIIKILIIRIIKKLTTFQNYYQLICSNSLNVVRCCYLINYH